MTDNEIIKALECCISRQINICDDCPFHTKCDNGEELGEYALDLINRQKAEIGRLNKQLEELKFLESRVNSIKNTPKDTFSGILISMAEGVARYEAIEEFAERLKEEFMANTDNNGDINSCLVPIIIDNLVKEMVGEG